MKNFRVTKERMTQIFKEHGMSEFDFQDFFNRFGSNGPYHIQDIRYFLGY